MGYSIDIPDEAPHELEIRDKVPSYKKIALAILDNDLQLYSLGYQRSKSKWYSHYKKIELEARQTHKQITLDI